VKKKQAEIIIDQVQSADKETARAAVARGVKEAQEKWIESALITEALALEIINIARLSQTESRIAAQLRAIALSLDTKVNLH